MTIKTTTTQVAVDLDRRTDSSDNVTLVATTMGVGVEYRLYMDMVREDEVWTSKYYVVQWPMSGPFSAVKRALETPREVITFISEGDDELANWRAWDEAATYLVRTASDDILRETVVL